MLTRRSRSKSNAKFRGKFVAPRRLLEKRTVLQLGGSKVKRKTLEIKKKNRIAQTESRGRTTDPIFLWLTWTVNHGEKFRCRKREDERIQQISYCPQVLIYRGKFRRWRGRWGFLITTPGVPTGVFRGMRQQTERQRKTTKQPRAFFLGAAEAPLGLLKLLGSLLVQLLQLLREHYSKWKAGRNRQSNAAMFQRRKTLMVATGDGGCGLFCGESLFDSSQVSPI